MTVRPSQRLRRSPVGQIGVALSFGLIVALFGPSVMAAVGDESTPVEVCNGDPGGTGIAGTVTESGSGDPVPGAWVAVLRTSDHTVAGGAIADDAGVFNTQLPAGPYHLYLIDPAGGHTAAFFGPPTKVTVVDGQVNDVHPTMSSALGSIVGTVREDTTANPIGGAWALALSRTTGVPETGVVADGAGMFALDGLSPGGHFVAYIDPAGRHPAQFYPHATNVPDATQVPVTAGDSTIADGSLPVQTNTPHGAALSGTVTESGTNRPLPGMFVIALHSSDYTMARAKVTNASGQYTLNVAAGDYKLAFVDPTGSHNMEWHDNQPSNGLAAAASVTAPTNTNAALDANTGSLSGTVVDDPTGEPLACAWVLAIGPNGPAGGGLTGPDGTYTIDGLKAGTYRAAAIDSKGGRGLEYWQDSATYETADVFAVAAGSATNIDTELGFRPPPNDLFTNAEIISGATGTIGGTNTQATKEPGEPNHGGETGGRSVWYRWTAPTTGTATFDTCGSDYDTLLAAYSGTAVNGLTSLAGNDDFCGTGSRITFPTTAGATYRIAIDGYDANFGQHLLHWTSP